MNNFYSRASNLIFDESARLMHALRLLDEVKDVTKIRVLEKPLKKRCSISSGSKQQGTSDSICSSATSSKLTLPRRRGEL